MIKKIIVLLVILINGGLAWAQDHYITNLYEYELYLMNPAAAGGDKSCIQLTAFHQKQWFDMEGSPSTQVFSFQTGITSQLGSGTYIYNDLNGYTSEIGLQQTFSYEIKLMDDIKRKSYLAFGLALNIEQIKYDETSFTDYDPVITGSVESGMGGNANVGILYKYNRFHMGFSLTNLLGQTNSIYDVEDEESVSTDINIHGGTWFKLKSRDIFLYPEVMYRFNNMSDSRFDVNLKATMPTYCDNLTFWSILSYRRSVVVDYGSDLSACATLGVNIGVVSFGVEYQQSLTGTSSYYGNAFQAVLGYRFKCKQNKNGRIPCSFQDIIYDSTKGKGGRIKP